MSRSTRSRIFHNVPPKSYLFSIEKSIQITITSSFLKAPTSFSNGKKLQFIGGGMHFPRREGAPLGENGLAKCERWGSTSLPAPLILHMWERKREEGFHLSIGRNPSLGMCHLSSRGAHFLLMTTPNSIQHVPKSPITPSHVPTRLS